MTSDIKSEAHSRIGASSMHRWSVCPGSVRESKGIPSKSSKYADEGTLAHDLAAKELLGTTTKEEMLSMSLEMRKAIRVYTDCVLEAHSESKKSVLLVETKFDLTSVHAGLFGTADAIVYNPDKKLLRVFDFKYGAGIQVDVTNNEQLMYYGLGALIQSGFAADNIELVIVQPRCGDGEPKRWSFPTLEILDFAADLKVFAQKTEDPNAPLVPGEHCRFCPAAAAKCPKIHEKALEAAKLEFSPTLSYDPAKLSKALSLADTLKAWIKNVEEFAFQEVSDGKTIPGYKLVEKRATREWNNEDLAITLAAKYLPKGQIFKDPAIKSPAALEKLIGKKNFGEFESAISKESSGLTLVPESDKRPSAKLDASKEFKKIENNETDIFN